MVQLNVSRLYISRADEGLPALEQIPAMQRRRLSSIAKLALNSAMTLLAQTQVSYLVWVSQYGDEHKTLNILQDALQEQTPSPTQFSTSVHNAVSGLYSILCKDAAPAVSLAGSWNDGLTEAYAWLKTAAPGSSALVVYYDEPLPEIYREHEDFSAFSLAASVTLTQPNLHMQLGADIKNQSYYKGALEFYRFWQDNSLQQLQAWQKC